MIPEWLQATLAIAFTAAAWFGAGYQCGRRKELRAQLARFRAEQARLTDRLHKRFRVTQ